MHFNKIYTQKVLCTLLALSISISVFGQLRPSDGSLQISQSNVIKSMNNSMDLPSGTANIFIPIFEFKTNDQAIPIGLSYQTGGIKTNYLKNGPFGIGWELAGGGKITRIVNGQSDLTYKMEYPREVEEIRGDIERGYANYTNYESDMYFFQTPVASGMFIMDSDKNAIIIPYQNVDIEWHEIVPDDKSGYFTLRDTQGNVYEFGRDETDREDVTFQTIYTDKEDIPQAYTSTWHMNKITSIKGEVIDYSYVELKPYTFNTILTLHHYQKSNGTFQYVGVGDIVNKATIASPKIISTISWGNNSKVIFNINGNKIWKISISNTIKPSKNIYEIMSFKYSNVDGSFLLDDISVSNSYLGGTSKLYAFEYFNSNKPRYYSCHDWWGYYNGTHNRDKIPAAGSTKVYTPDRDPKLEYARYYNLKTITLPNGGKREYVYELNDGYTSDNNYMQIGGLRVAEIKTISNLGDTQSTRYEYKDAFGNSSGVLFAESVLNTYETLGANRKFKYYTDTPLNALYDVNGRNVVYSTVKEINSDNTTKYTFTAGKNEDEKDILSEVSYYHRRGAGELFSKPTSISDNTSPFVIGNIPIKNTSKFWRRGLLKSKKVFDLNGNLNIEEVYEYLFEKRAGKVIENYQYYLLDAALFGSSNYIEHTYITSYKWLSESVQLRSKEVKKGVFNQYSKTEYLYDTQTLAPKKETITDCEGNIIERVIRYPFSFNITEPIDTSSPEYGLFWLKKNKILTPIETIVTKNGTLLSSELNEYKFNELGRQYVLPFRKYILSPKTMIKNFSYYFGSGPIDPRYKLILEYCSYDNHGRLITKKENNIIESYIYDNKSATIIARVRNAICNYYTYNGNQLFYTSFENYGEDLSSVGKKAKSGYRAHARTYNVNVYLNPGSYMLSYWRSDDGMEWTRDVIEFIHSGGYYNKIINSNNYIDEIRIHPTSAQMETITYLPYMKTLSESDINGKTKYYQYDYMGRVSCILDDNRNIISEYEYHTILE